MLILIGHVTEELTFVLVESPHKIFIQRLRNGDAINVTLIYVRIAFTHVMKLKKECLNHHLKNFPLEIRPIWLKLMNGIEFN
jgi:hypothetical protein